MGATGWFHETDWQDDAQAALDTLCDGLFREGQYDKLWETYPDMLEEMGEEFEGFDEIPGLTESIHSIAGGGQPTTLDAAAFLNQESGFGSILDCRMIQAEAGFGTVSPIEHRVLQRLFNTERPSVDSVRAAEDALLESPMLERWSGRYLTAYYAESQPKSLFFFGFSGD